MASSDTGSQNLSVPMPNHTITSSRSSSQTALNSPDRSRDQLAGFSSPKKEERAFSMSSQPWANDPTPQNSPGDEEMQPPTDPTSANEHQNAQSRTKRRKVGNVMAMFQPGGLLRPFRLMKKEFKARASIYLTDWTINQLVIASAVYVFFTNLLPGITFASDLDALTGSNYGTIEVVFSTGLCGIIFSLWVEYLQTSPSSCIDADYRAAFLHNLWLFLVSQALSVSWLRGYTTCVSITSMWV